jgi:hypothetical protein
MSVPESAVGRRVQCPRCESIFRYTGQKELTLGRVREFAGAGAAVGAASALAGAAGIAGSAKAVAPRAPVTTPSASPQYVETMPVIDLPQVPQALLDKLNDSKDDDDLGPIEEVEEPDLEMFHSTPAEMELPEVSEADIEALFQDDAPSEHGTRPPSHPTVRSLEATIPVPQRTMPNLDLGSGPAETAAEPADDVLEILDAEQVVEELKDADVVEIAETDIEDADIADADIAEVDIAEVTDAEAVMDFEDVEAVDDIVEIDGAASIETLPVATAPQGAPTAAASLRDQLNAATAPDFQIDPSYFGQPVEEPLDPNAATEAPTPPIATAAPVLTAKPVLGAAPVPGVPVAGVPVAGVVRAAARVATPVAPASNDPIAPPTPAVQPVDEADLDALFQDAIGEAPAEIVEDVEEIHDIEEIEELVADDVVEVHDAPVVEAAEGDAAEGDLDLMSLFEDDAPADAEAVEVVDDAEFLFEDEPPAKSQNR